MASALVTQCCACPRLNRLLGNQQTPSLLGAQVGEIEPRVDQTNQQFEEAAAAQRAAERNLRQLHSKVACTLLLTAANNAKALTAQKTANCPYNPQCWTDQRWLSAQVDQIEPRVYELDTVSTAIRQLHSKVRCRSSAGHHATGAMLRAQEYTPCSRDKAQLCRSSAQVDQIEPRIFELDAVSATVRQLHSKVHSFTGMPRCMHLRSPALPVRFVSAVRCNTER